jgi:flagellin-like protein
MSNIKKFNIKQKNNKAKKGISPVIATVILVAVAVVIAAAMAGFSSSLFGTYSDTPNVDIRNVEVAATGLAGTFDVTNSGGSADRITNISIPGTDLADATGWDLNANSDQTAVAFTLAGTDTLNSGQQVTMKFFMQSGSEITQSVTVGP